MPYCPYCGAPTKDSDKYCIICGKPLLTDVSKKRREEKLKEKKEIISPKEESKKKEEESSIQEEEQVESDLKEKEEEKKKKKSIDEKAEEKEIVEIDIEPLPEDVKQKIDYFIEYSELKLNKDALKDKLDNVSKLMKDERYEYDFDFKSEVNIKFEAIKTLINELKDKEES
ncbi:MAG: zinc ribbon domain-containing protein [Candidatus Lokiarchaeota archaeon]